jgi:hypothetical protein
MGKYDDSDLFELLTIHEKVVVERGGPGSGHFGHEGRPGEVGGSKPSKDEAGDPPAVGKRWPDEFRSRVTEAIEDEFSPVAPEELRDEVRHGPFWMLPDGRLVKVNQHLDLVAGLDKHIPNGPFSAMNLYRQGFVRGLFNPHGSRNKPILMFELNTEAMRSPIRKALNTVYWTASDSKEGPPVIYLDYLDMQDRYGTITNAPWSDVGVGEIEDINRKLGFRIDKSDQRSILEQIFTMVSQLVRRGGPGSGHHGHLGRPGKVGGSLPRAAGLTRPLSPAKRAAMMDRLKQGEWDFSMVGGIIEEHMIGRQEAGRFLMEELGIDGVTARRLVSSLETIVTERQESFISPTELLQTVAKDFLPDITEAERTPPLERADPLEATEFGLPIGERSDRVLDSLRDVEEEISDLHFERFLIVDPRTGRVRYRQDGGLNEVEVPREPSAFARDAIMIHNHPRGTPPSPEDIIFSISTGAAETHVYHSDGRYVVRFNRDMRPFEWMMLSDGYQTAYRSTKKAVDEMFLRGEIGDQQAWNLLHGGTLKMLEGDHPELIDYSAETFQPELFETEPETEPEEVTVVRLP